MDDSAKRAGSAVITVICLIIWIALRAERCNRQNSYDYSYTPSYPVYNPDLYGGGRDYSSALDRTQKVLDELLEQDAAYAPAVAEVDPIAIGANTKNPQCAELDAVVEEMPSWKVHVSEDVLADDSYETQLMAPFPLYVTREDDGRPSTSPETIARTAQLAEKLADGSYVSVPALTTKDLLMEIAVMPKPEKGAKKIKGAPAPGKVIVRGWIYDHAQRRVVCSGFMLLPKPKAGENATRIDDKQLSKLIDQMPQALRSTPLPAVEAD